MRVIPNNDSGADVGSGKQASQPYSRPRHAGCMAQRRRPWRLLAISESVTLSGLMLSTSATLLDQLRQVNQPQAWVRFVQLYSPLLLYWAGRQGFRGAGAELVRSAGGHGRTCAMASTHLTGRWVGHYLQQGQEYPITADFREAGESLSGFMYDGQPDRESSVFQATAEAGLPPGADEQIEAKLREMVPDVAPGPIRYVSHLPPNSILRGRRTGQTVRFLKTYQGTSFGGYRVGDHLLGYREADHEVHYEGQLSSDGLVIEGRWWIDADPTAGAPLTEGRFHLRRSEASETPSAQPAVAAEKEKPPWWRFWS